MTSSDLSAVEVVRAIDSLIAESTRLRAENEELRLGKPTNRKKLSKREVELIRDMSRKGFNVTSIADTFDVNHGTISRILSGAYHK